VVLLLTCHGKAVKENLWNAIPQCGTTKYPGIAKLGAFIRWMDSPGATLFGVAG
jgi:hypothetical protein